MNFDQHIFRGLGGYLPARIHFRPIEDSGVVIQVTLRREQLSFLQRVIGNNRCDIRVNQPLLCPYSPQGQDIPGMDLRAFVDVIDHVDVMRIALGDYVGGFTKAGGEIARLQIMSNDAGAIRLDQSLRVGLAFRQLETAGCEF